MFRTLIYPSSGACEYSVELPHWSYCSWFDVCWSFGVVGLEAASACNTDTTPTQTHRNSNTHRTKNNTTNVVIQQNIRKLLMMGILMSETCWAHKKWNKIASDIKLVFYSSTITMMHSPINVKFVVVGGSTYSSFNNDMPWQDEFYRYCVCYCLKNLINCSHYQWSINISNKALYVLMYLIW